MLYNKGDKVTIIKPKNVPLENGEARTWWVDDMDQYIGRTLTIAGKIGIEYRVVENNFSWLEQWFEDPVLRLINEVTK